MATIAKNTAVVNHPEPNQDYAAAPAWCTLRVGGVYYGKGQLVVTGSSDPPESGATIRWNAGQLVVPITLLAGMTEAGAEDLLTKLNASASTVKLHSAEPADDGTGSEIAQAGDANVGAGGWTIETE